MYAEKIYDSRRAAVCYFRTTAAYPNKKVLLQLTEKCNLHCEHCFVSSKCTGNEMTYKQIEAFALPAFINSKVTKVTLTGGEPLLHPDIVKIIKLLSQHNIAVSICTNGSLITESLLDQIQVFSNIHFNISLDGFSYKSHGRFRGITSEEDFSKIISNIQLLGKRELLNGILVTPNVYSSVDEYVELCKFAVDVHARYVLMNPLSEFGRGQYSSRLGFSEAEMNRLKNKTQCYNNEQMEVVYIRFPNEGKPLGSCVAGRILYVFTNGDITICPYMVFATKNDISKYNPQSFIFANIFEEPCDIDLSLSEYHLPNIGIKNKSSNCTISNCGQGCNAAKISKGLVLSDCDEELCPLSRKEGHKV